MKQEEIVQGFEQSLNQEGCQEDNEESCNVPPRIEEHEVEELEAPELAPELKPSWVVEEFKQLLLQKYGLIHNKN